MNKPTEDPLLAALARAAREERDEEQALARFEPLASPDLPDDARALLESEAAKLPDGGDELLALLRPLDDTAHASMAAAAAAALHANGGGAATDAARAGANAGTGAGKGVVGAVKEAGASADKAAASPDAAPTASDAVAANGTAAANGNAAANSNAAASSNGAGTAARTASPATSGAAPAAGGVVVPLKPRPHAWRTTAIAAAVAIAAGVALFLTTRSPATTLPAYEASVSAAISTARGPDDGPPVLVPGKPVRIRLRPEQNVGAKVMAITALRQSGRLTQLDGSVQTFEGGALALQLVIPPDLAPGPADLLIVIAGESELPSTFPTDTLTDTPRRRVLLVPVVVSPAR